MKTRKRLLFIVEQCNPEWASVPLIGYRLYEALTKHLDITLVTHERNREAFARKGIANQVVFIKEPPFLKKWYTFFSKIFSKNGTNWPLQTLFSYPIYAHFNQEVYRKFHQSILDGHYDLIHAFSPVPPRYPVKIGYEQTKIPFILGPVNGGLAYPPGFEDIAQKEFSRFTPLRHLSRLIPGYTRTYRSANKILVGSQHAKDNLKNILKIPEEKFKIFHENGIPQAFFNKETYQLPKKEDPLELLFVGRLVPCKSVKTILESLFNLKNENVHLTIVGDGEERCELEAFTKEHTLPVTFTGWIPQEQTARYYAKAHIFCFPSIREFGGGVVLEALAAGLPCIVADYGGVSEYVDSCCGVKLPLESPEALKKNLTNTLKELIANPKKLKKLSEGARKRAENYSWEHRADKLITIYEELCKKG